MRPATQKLRGAYYTAPGVASFLVRWAVRSQALWFTEMTAVEVLGSVDELAAGTGSIDAVTGAAICPYWKSRSREI